MENELHIDPSGTKTWWLNGEYHREDGPAIEYTNGDKYWFLNDKRHREDGPAVELADGSKFWFLNGKELTETEFENYLFIKWVKDGVNFFKKTS